MNLSLLMAGATPGILLSVLQTHPRRRLGLVPFGMTGLLLVLLIAALFPSAERFRDIGPGFMGGFLCPPLGAVLIQALPARLRGRTAMLVGAVIVATLMPLTLLWLGAHEDRTTWWIATGIVALGTLLAWWLLLREVIEQILESALWPLYRIRASGPGIRDCPPSGPLLIVANHSCYFDPLWLAKVFPRRLIAMMTSVYYDLPVMHWLMTRVARAIRVEAATFRREAPELREAVAALDRGESVIIFPEGMLRRREEVPLRPFGQGIWHILRERPQTPVITCWIEGGWGSFTSYWKGPPLKNKRLDFWRRVRIGANAPLILPADILAEHRATRNYLRQACSDARAHLGLPPLAKGDSPLEEIESEEEESGKV